jgi:hypothetical protein
VTASEEGAAVVLEGYCRNEKCENKPIKCSKINGFSENKPIGETNSASLLAEASIRYFFAFNLRLPAMLSMCTAFAENRPTGMRSLRRSPHARDASCLLHGEGYCFSTKAI